MRGSQPHTMGDGPFSVLLLGPEDAPQPTSACMSWQQGALLRAHSQTPLTPRPRTWASEGQGQALLF